MIDRGSHRSRRLVLAGVATLALIAGGALAPAAAQDDVVNIFNWSDYIGETTLDDFTAETGIETNYDVYDSNEVLEARLLAGNSGYDVVVPTAMPFLARGIDAGVYQPLDFDRIPNAQYLDPALMERVQSADPNNEYAVIYQWGTNGFGYNVADILERDPDAPVNSWDMVFDPEIVSQFEDCGVTILDSADEMIPVALHYLGLDPNSGDADDVAAAEELLMSIRPYVRYFHSSQYINDLANGDVCLSVGFSGDIIQAQYRAIEAGNGEQIEYVIAQEGTLIWFDVLAIPADAPHPEAAHEFINFVLRPDVMAGITNYVAYANAVPDSFELLDEEILNDPAIFPSPEVQERLFPAQMVDSRTQRLWTRTWTRVRTGI
jgi:putrescine transport system substrate-binding protein